MQKKCLSLTVATLLSFPAFSAMAVDTTLTGDVSIGAHSIYLSRGFDVLPDENMVVQPGLDLSLAGFTLSLWANYAENSGKISETDISLDYTFAVNDLVSLTFGNAYYDYDGGPNTNEIYVTCQLTTLLSPTLNIYYDWDQSNETGIWATFALSHSITLHENLGLNLDGTIGYNFENYSTSEDYSNFQMAELHTSIDWTFAPNTKLTPSLTYSLPLSDDAKDLGGIGEELLASLTATYTF